MVQVQKNTSQKIIATEITGSSAAISKNELWQSTLQTWQNIGKKIPKNHTAWRVLSAFYEDFVGTDFDKEKGMWLLAEFAKATEVMKLQYPDYQHFTQSSIYQKLFQIWQNLLQEYPLQIPEALSVSSNSEPIEAKKASHKDLDPACFNFALMGAEVYAEKFFNSTLKEKNHKILLQNDLATHLKDSWLEYLPKRGAKTKIEEDFFWHCENLMSYFIQLEAAQNEQNPFPAALTWGRLAQIKKATWQSLQATLFSPISVLQQHLTQLQKSQFTAIFSEAKADFTDEFDFLAEQSIWIGLLPNNYFQSNAYQSIKMHWAAHFSVVYQWNLLGYPKAWVFALKTAKPLATSLHLRQYDCPQLQSPLSWLALKNILESEAKPLLEEAQAPIYTSQHQTNTPQQAFVSYPLLGQETPFETIGEGIFGYSFEGIALPKQKTFWAEDAQDLAQTVAKYLKSNQQEASKQALFAEDTAGFQQKYIAKLGLCPFQTVNFYAEPGHWAEGAKLTKLFNAEKSQTFIHLAVHQYSLSVWASSYPISRNFMGKSLSLARQHYEKNEEILDNIRPEAIRFFKDHYESQWQEKAETLKWALQKLLNLSILEDCQVEPELALEMRVLAQLGENIAFAKQLFGSIYQPNPTTFNHFKSLKEIFFRTKRSFEQLGKKQSRGKESYDTLRNYFEEGTNAIYLLEDFMEEAQRKEIDLERSISPQDIFEYTYAVLHTLIPASNRPLRDLHIPLYQDFWTWAETGAKLLALHLQPEEVSTRPLKIQERYLRKGVKQLKIKCIAAENSLVLQDKHFEWCITQLPNEVFEFYLGKQLALQWLAQALATQFEIQEEHSFLEKYPEAVQLYLQKHIRAIVETVRIKKLLSVS